MQALEVVVLSGSAGRPLRGADLRGTDLRGADLRGADLVEADLRNADLRGADLFHADLRRALLHGADLRETRVGNASLGHRGGDPELTFIFNPEVTGARADDDTLWPEKFGFVGTGIVFDGPGVNSLEGQVVNVPIDWDGRVFATWGGGLKEGAPVSNGHGHVYRVQGWSAWISTDTGSEITLPGDRLLASNLQLLTGQRAFYQTGWWQIVGHDDELGTLTLERGSLSVVVLAADHFERNLRRWWWHFPGAEWYATS